MKIFLDATVMEMPATGVTKATLSLYDACLQVASDVSVVALHRKPLMCDVPAGVGTAGPLSFLPSVVWRSMYLPAFAFSHRPAIMHFPWNGHVPNGLAGAKIIITLHDVLPLVIPNAFRNADEERRYRHKVQSDLDRCDLLMTVSNYSKREIVANFKVQSEPLVVPLAPTLTDVGEMSPRTSRESIPYFIYVGGYDRRKGVDKLVKVFLQLHREKRLQSKLILTGSKNYFSGEFKENVLEGVRLGVIEEKGYVSDVELAALLRGARALAYPSKYEGFGLPPLEAMALGCPVLTTRETSIPEVCGDAVYYLDPDADQSLAAGLMEFENNEELRLDFRARGLSHAKNYSWERSAAIYLRAVRALANG
jgi:glycosyltransferase involved in cell wall biosynthesis